MTGDKDTSGPAGEDNGGVKEYHFIVQLDISPEHAPEDITRHEVGVSARNQHEAYQIALLGVARRYTGKIRVHAQNREDQMYLANEVMYFSTRASPLVRRWRKPHE